MGPAGEWYWTKADHVHHEIWEVMIRVRIDSSVRV